MEKMFTLFVGTYGNEIFRYNFNPQTLECIPDGSAKIENGSFLALGGENGSENHSPDFIYAVTESGSRSAVHALRNDARMQRINTERSVGKDPCYVIYYQRHVLTANYSGGSISVFPADAGGALLSPSQTIRFRGRGIHPQRQQSPHIHTVRAVPPLRPAGFQSPDPNNSQEYKSSGQDNPAESSSKHYLLATDLGSDKIYIFKAEETAPGGLRLVPASPESVPVPRGSGPRHVAFHPQKNLLYILTELSGMILVFLMEETAGGLDLVQIQEIEADPAAAQASGDIHIRPDGRFLYVSNRNVNDGIVYYRIEPDGLLTRAGFVPTGSHPRNFLITPEGELLLVACKNDKLIQIFRIDRETGSPGGPLKTIVFEREEPVCLVLAPAHQSVK